MRKFREKVFDRGELHLFQDFSDASLSVSLKIIDHQRFGQDTVHAHERRQSAVGVLLDVADLRAIPTQISVEGAPLKEHPALGGPIEPQDRPGEGGFAAAALADDGDRFALVHIEADAIYSADEARSPKRSPTQLEVRVQVLHR